MEIQFIIASFIAGVLTILAPCIIPVLPIVVGGSVGHKSRLKPLVITGSLMISIILFTLLLRATTDAIGLSVDTLQNVAGVILVIFGLITIFPDLWEKFSARVGFSKKSNMLLGKYVQRGDLAGDVLVGAALGPVFTSCSPTYAVIVSLVISGEFAVGTTYLTLYAFGLGLMLLIVAYSGQALVAKLGWATNPKGVFKRVIGVLFVLVGIAILTGYDRKIEAWVLEQGFYDPIAEFEDNLRE